MWTFSSSAKRYSVLECIFIEFRKIKIKGITTANQRNGNI